METDSNMPVPEPIAPIKSEKTEMSPMIIPPHAAATGIYLLRIMREDFY